MYDAESSQLSSLLLFTSNGNIVNQSVVKTNLRSTQSLPIISCLKAIFYLHSLR